MPRGVPKSGVRRTRTVIAAEQQAAEDEPAVAVSAVHDTAPVTVASVAQETAEAPVELTAEQREIKYLKDQLARERGRKDIEPEPDQPVDGESIVIHYLEDGLTVNGQIKYRGDESEFPIGSAAYRDTFDRLGRTWLDLRHDEFAQADRWGKIMFRNGPWPGKTYADGKWETMRAEKGEGSLKPPSQEEIHAAEKARRNRLAPRLPQEV